MDGRFVAAHKDLDLQGLLTRGSAWDAKPVLDHQEAQGTRCGTGNPVTKTSMSTFLIPLF